MNKKINIENIKQLVPFSHRKIKDKYLIVNDWGDFLFLKNREFNDLFYAESKFKNSFLVKLCDSGFLKKTLNKDIIIEKYRKKKNYLFSGPSLHIVVVTLRCNFNCIYCHASARNIKEGKYDMSEDTARKVLDMSFSSNNDFIAIEFQGGEPLLNFPIVKYIIKNAQEINKKKNKNLEIRLVTNGSLLDDKKFEYLLKNKVSICLSLDGPKSIHNNQRLSQNKDNYARIMSIIKKFNKKYKKLKTQKYIWKIATSLTITKNSLKYPKEIIDSHLNLGLDTIYLRHLNPFGFSLDSWGKIGYPIEHFLKFYREALDYILEINRQGKFFKERLSSVFLAKILTDNDPNHLEFRSPCGAGIGQLAYNYNGDVYTCDEGRMLSMMGDESFKIGNVHKNNYQETVTSPVVRTVCTASCVEVLPGCEQCAYKPFCSVCPILNYSQHGNIFPKAPNNERCKLAMGIMDYLFEKMQNEKNLEIFLNWVE